MSFRDAIRDPRQQLILLGFVCQGYSFENWLMPIGYAAVWAACLAISRPRRFLPDGGEELVALLAILGAYYVGSTLGDRYGYNRLVFIGNGLVVFQCMRLLRPLNLREKMYSIAIALIHLGVGTQVIVDYEFVLFLLAAIYLVPRALFSLEAETYHKVAGGSQASLNRSQYAYLGVLMIAFFLFFPRIPISTGNARWGGLGGGRQPNQIDHSAPGSEGSELLLFRVEGDDVSYIKSTVLDRFDGERWAKSSWVDRGDILRDGDTTAALPRTVTLFAANRLGALLPVDGMPVRAEVPHYDRVYLTEAGGLLVPVSLRRNFTYRYWTEAGPMNQAVSARRLADYRQYPRVSADLERWLDRTTRGLTDPEAIAGTLVNHFQEAHEYDLGAPDLSRQAPVDDFVLNARSGHCERFASALAVLLRMKNIPARVAIGWLATERNQIGSFYNVRARHGHAWTEAWIPGKGWVIFDATPFGEGFNLEPRSLGLTVYEWIEYIWYSKIVEFGFGEQVGVFEALKRGVQGGFDLFVTYMFQIINVLSVIALGWFVWYVGRRWWRWRQGPVSRRRALREARSFYGRMLKLLARRRIYLQPGQTPWELLRVVEAKGHPAAAEVRQLTAWFCDIRYGNRELDPKLQAAVQQALTRIGRG